MKTLAATNFRRARDFIAEKARPVDATMFAYTLGGEPKMRFGMRSERSLTRTVALATPWSRTVDCHRRPR